jgi:hypothetical protein
VIENQYLIEPNHIKQPHWKEWVTDSGVDPFITSLNIVSLEGLAIYDRLFVSDSLPRQNTGVVSSTIYKKYFPLENGGWWCNGVDVLGDFEPELWGQFKGDTPRKQFLSKGFGKLPFGPSTKAQGRQAQGSPETKTVKYDPPP